MTSFQEKLSRIFPLKLLSSVNIATVCLILLFILTLWGTIDQIHNGLYHAQEKFFHSWMFTFFWGIPFPGARLILWVMFINLICTLMINIKYCWSHAGIILIHFGLLFFLVSAFVLFHGVEESSLTLLEGTATNVSQDYQDWELSVWKSKGEQKKVLSLDIDHSKLKQMLHLGDGYFTIVIDKYYTNSNAFAAPDPNNNRKIINAMGLKSLKPIKNELQPEANIPGVIFHLIGEGQTGDKILLYGGETEPTRILVKDQNYFLQLRRKRYLLPFTIKLKDFMMEFHPKTEIPRSFKSLVEVITSGVSREVLISMNKPLRSKGYTLYQDSYIIDEFKKEYSTFAVVKNPGRLLPHLACLITFVGLFVHLCLMAFQSKANINNA